LYAACRKVPRFDGASDGAMSHAPRRRWARSSNNAS
jgi:hypothetical protein